jgi:hypothetical protein
MGLFGGDDGGGLADVAGGIIGVGGGDPYAAIAANQGIGAYGAGGMGGITDRLAGYDPSRAIKTDFRGVPISSAFDARGPNMAQAGFPQALAAAQQNSAMAFAPGAGGAPSFAQGLMGNYNQAQAQQQGLINSLQGQAMGQGPGAQLSNNFMNQAMGQNAANAMGLAASQKGINPAMAARIGGQNAAMMNAQAAGQGANMNLQQQLGAQQQLGSMLGQNQALNAQTFGQAMSGANQQFGTLANQQMDINHLDQLTQAQNAQNAMGAQQINANVASENLKGKTGMLGGLFNGIGGAVGKMAMASEGGRVPGQAPHNGDYIKNDTVPAMLSPGEIVIPRSAATDREKAMKFLDALKSGDGSWGKKKKGKKDE